MSTITTYAVKGSQLTTAEIDANFNNLNTDKFQRSTILGTVSQAAGVPTGAIIERGSNANGEYVRFADGTQICVGSDTGQTANNVFGSVYGSGGISLSFPAAFSAKPVTTPMPSTSSGWTVAVATSGTSVSVFGVSPINGTVITSSYIAVGRWF